MRRLAIMLLFALAAACGAPASTTSSGDDKAASENAATTLRLYTTVTQETVDSVVAGFEEEHPDVEVEVFRAPTGELTARIAAEQRDGEVGADVLWLTDPLSMEVYEADGVLAQPPSDAVDAVDDRFASEGYVGTRLLNVVVVHHDDVRPPRRWTDLADLNTELPVAIPDPAFAGSALGALGYFAQDGEGMAFYQDLHDAGATQVQAPDEIVTGVAEGRFAAGMTLDNTARTAEEKGSPIGFVAPEPGAVAIFSPIAVVADATNADDGGDFVSYVVTKPAQERIAATGWEPIRDDVEWEHDVPQVFPNWEEIAAGQDELLEEYRAIFGG